MGVRKKFSFLFYCFFVLQLVTGVPIDEASRTSIFSDAQPKFFNSASKLSSSSLENRFKSSSSNRGASINSVGSTDFRSSAKSLNDKLSQSFQKLKPFSSSQNSVFSSKISSLTPDSSSSNSVNSLTDTTASSFNPASLFSSTSFSNGRSLPNLPFGSSNQASSILGASSGSLVSSGPSSEGSLTENADPVPQVSSNLNPLLDSVSDVNSLSSGPRTQLSGSSKFNNGFPFSSPFSSQSSSKREIDLESTSTFPSIFNSNLIRGKPLLKLEGISKPSYSVEADSLNTYSASSAASNSNGLSTSTLTESSGVGANALNSNSFNSINAKPFNPFGQFSNPIGSSNEAIAQPVSENSPSVSTAYGIGLRTNTFAGLSQPNTYELSSKSNPAFGANNLINNNILNNNLIGGPVSSLAQQSPLSGVVQSSVSISNAQTTTPSPVGFTNLNSNQGFSSFTNSASSVSNVVSSPNNPIATPLNQGTNLQFSSINQQNNNLQNILSNTQSLSQPTALSSSSIGSQTQSFSLSPQIPSQTFIPMNSFSFASDSSSMNNANKNSAGTENNEVTVQTNSINLLPNSQAFGQNNFANAQPASSISSSQGFSAIAGNGRSFVPFGTLSENIASQLNSPSQLNTPSNVQSVSSFTSNGLSQSVPTQSNSPSLSPVNYQASFNALPNTQNLQSTSSESSIASNNPSLSSVNSQASFSLLPNTLKLQSSSTESSFASNNPSVSSFNNQPSSNILSNTINLQSTSTESPFVLNNSPSLTSINNQASFSFLPNTLNLQPLSSINAFAGSLANAIQPTLSLTDNQITQTLNNGVTTEQVQSVSSSTSSSLGNSPSFVQNPSVVGLPQYKQGTQNLPLTQFTNLPSSFINPDLSPNQRYNSLSSGSLSNVFSNSQPGSSLASDNSLNTVIATPSSGNTFGISSLNSNIAESSASISSLANGFGINSQAPLVLQNQVTENSVITITAPSSAYSSNLLGSPAFNSSLGRGFNPKSLLPSSDSSNTVIENSVNTVSITPSQNQFTILPYNSNVVDTSVSLNSLGSGLSINSQSSTDSFKSSLGSAPNALGSLPSSNAFTSNSINSIQDSVNNLPYSYTPVNGATNQALNLPSIQLLNSYPSNNILSQNEAFAEQVVQNVNLQPISQITAPFNQASTLTKPIVNSNYLSPISNFASSNSISALSTTYPAELSYTLPPVTSPNQANAITSSDSVSSHQLGFNSANSLPSGFALPPNTLSSPSSIVISPGFTQTSLPNPVLAAPSYLPPIFVGNSRSSDCVDDFIELIVLSELFNGIDCNCNCINNPWLAYLLTCL